MIKYIFFKAYRASSSKIPLIKKYDPNVKYLYAQTNTLVRFYRCVKCGTLELNYILIVA